MAAMVVPFVKSFQPLMPRASEFVGPAASVKLTGMTRIFRWPIVQVDLAESAPQVWMKNPATKARMIKARRQRGVLTESGVPLKCMVEA
jgi:hypothetical protein